MTSLSLDSVHPLILRALEEDIAIGDVTSEAIFPPDADAQAVFLVKRDGVICGLDVARWVCEEVAKQSSDDSFVWESYMKEGSLVYSGSVVARVHGRARTLLKAERTALNFLQRLSGVASLTRRYVQAVEGTQARIADTRKTIPGWRVLDKYAVAIGGGLNHRMGLFDMVLIKDNHRDAAGSLSDALRLCHQAFLYQPAMRIEVETRTLDDVREVLTCLEHGLRIDRVMLDNFSPSEAREAVKIIAGKLETEASGNITLANVRAFAEAGVNIISVGALTHSAPALDISMKFRHDTS
ncbi:MAG: carboxylating nicotinate-nucleotide diphosphorylase [Bacteroidota bacterium]|nr:carboxylating nicotinate-nucleotide diphosphorylase [Candidatus Kapabacteria bacterium]MDW8219772.1 carboxylating nicotinate-nucleotide diphosphorylase [Bacteroidota bacterium]